MTRSVTDYSFQRTIVIVGVSLALLILPLLGMQQRQATHIDHTHSASPVTGPCCVFLCFTVLVGLSVTSLRGLTLARAALYLEPVRLSDHLTPWVPPPRPIGFRA